MSELTRLCSGAIKSWLETSCELEEEQIRAEAMSLMDTIKTQEHFIDEECDKTEKIYHAIEDLLRLPWKVREQVYLSFLKKTIFTFKIENLPDENDIDELKWNIMQSEKLFRRLQYSHLPASKNYSEQAIEEMSLDMIERIEELFCDSDQLFAIYDALARENAVLDVKKQSSEDLSTLDTHEIIGRMDNLLFQEMCWDYQRALVSANDEELNIISERTLTLVITDPENNLARKTKLVGLFVA